MHTDPLRHYREIWLVDCEFRPAGGQEGSLPEVICLVAHELRSRRTIRLRKNQLGKLPPYPTNEDALFVAYYASAEIGCHLALSWPMPRHILDLFAEFRNRTNGLSRAAGLIDALVYHGLDHMGAHEKTAMRELILAGGPWSDAEWSAILDYCEADVAALGKLLPAMLPKIDLPRALLRGRYMAAAARMEHHGVPIDIDALGRIETHREAIKDRLIAEIDRDYRVYEGRSFRERRFAGWVQQRGLPWPSDARGRLRLDDDAFRAMERSYPEVAPLRQLRAFLSETRSTPLPVGVDGRNRVLLSAFGSVTGRNQPSSARAIFHRPAWNRSLIKPSEGYGIAYIDYSQQEVGIAAALSGDLAMQRAYTSGDPYLEFGKQAKVIPADGTKKSHKAERDRFKACVLAVQYGMQAESLANIIGCPVIEARELLRLHRQTYPRFWAWSEAMVDYALLGGELQTVFGWTVIVAGDANPRSLANFPMQANGAEMLRLACSMATEAGIKICAPVHDAVLIEAPLDMLDQHISCTQDMMAEASRIVLDGFALRTDVEIVRYPDRYMDPRGTVMWDRVMALIIEAQGWDRLTGGTPATGTGAHA
jgi:DNA polymerase-1